MKNSLLLLAVISIGTSAAQAKVDRASTKPLLNFSVPDFHQKITSEDVEKFVPTDLEATSDMNRVATRIADRSLQTWFNSTAVKNSPLGRTATNVQKKMATDITVKSSDPKAKEHKISMQVLALQATTKIEYTGWLNAVFNYDARAAESMLEFSEKIFNKDLFVNHTSSSREKVSTVGIKWGW